MNSLKPKKSSPEMAQKNGNMKSENGANDSGCAPPPYTSPPRRSKQVRALPPLSLPVSIPVTQLTKSFRSRFNIKQRRLSSGVKPSEMSPLKATHALGNLCGSDSSLSNSNNQDVSTKAIDNEKKND